jgi:prolyl oligopeptidase
VARIDSTKDTYGSTVVADPCRWREDQNSPQTCAWIGAEQKGTRVAPLHARKMAARLQAATGSNRPMLLLYETKSGHSDGRPISKVIEEGTDILSFLFWQLGVSEN